MTKNNLIPAIAVLRKFGSIALITIFLFSCAEETKRSGNENDKKKEESVKDEKDPSLMNIGGKVFSVPSPIQTAFLLKTSGAAYSSEMLSPTSNASNLSTTARKALNLGVYGADMGYATIYDQTQDAISYISITKRLSSELGMTNVFDEDLMKQYEANIGNQDSLLALVSEAFNAADGYLKSNKQNDLSVLILAGGWIETLHFATNIVNSNDDQNIKNRIGEQKITIKNLINLMLPYQDKQLVGDVINKLNELKDIYSGIEFNYVYNQDNYLSLLNFNNDKIIY